MSEDIEAHVLAKYKVIKKVGSGAYGIVWKVLDYKDKKVKALKKNFDAFHNSTDAQRTYREIMFLQKLEHPNIVKIEKVIRAENDRDIYIVFEYMDVDLYTLIREGILEDKHRKYIIYQVAKSVYYLHTADLIHRDLKPSNILVNESCWVKLCDFGLVRSVDDSFDRMDLLTEYIATRWYRAPEVVLGSASYNKSIDIWGLGCLIAEVFKGKPLFPGTSTINQLERIVAWTGMPLEKELTSLKLISESAGKETIKMLPKVKGVKHSDMIPKASNLCINLIDKCLQLDPNKRISIKQLLQHPFLSEFYQQSDLIASQKKIRVPISDNKRLSLSDYRNLIYQTLQPSKRAVGDINLYRIREKNNKFTNPDKIKKSDSEELKNLRNPVRMKSQHQADRFSQESKDSQKLLKKGRNYIKDSKTVSIKKIGPTSIQKKDSLNSKHLKTVESEWDPIETRKASMIKGALNRNNMYKKKRSVTETTKKPMKLFPSQIDIISSKCKF